MTRMAQRRLEQILPGLWATRTEYSFLGAHVARGFLVQQNSSPGFCMPIHTLASTRNT